MAPVYIPGLQLFAAALREAITDPRLRHLPLTGAVDQFTDSTDALGRLGFLRVCASSRGISDWVAGRLGDIPPPGGRGPADVPVFELLYLPAEILF